MSKRFPPEFVDALAAKFGLEKHRDELGSVLERAAGKHDTALGWRGVVDVLKRHRDPLGGLAKKVHVAIDEWDKLPEATRRHLGYVALIHRPAARRQHGRDGARNLTAEQIADRFRENLALLHDVAAKAGSEKFKRGNPRKSRGDSTTALDGLGAFAAEVQPFWTSAKRTPFSHDAREYTGRGRQPKAPDFLLLCAKYLGKYTFKNCQSALQNLNRKKRAR